VEDDQRLAAGDRLHRRVALTEHDAIAYCALRILNRTLNGSANKLSGGHGRDAEEEPQPAQLAILTPGC